MTGLLPIGQCRPAETPRCASHVQVETSCLDVPRCCTHACPTFCVDCIHTSSPHTVSDRTVVYLPSCYVPNSKRGALSPAQSGCLEGPFQPLLSVGIRQYRGNAMPARLASQAPGPLPRPSVNWAAEAVHSRCKGARCIFFPSFSSASPFISSWQGLGWGQSDTAEAPPCATTIVWSASLRICLPACLFVPDPIHMRPLRPLARSHQEHMSQVAGTVPICSMYAPRVSLAVPSPRMLTLLILHMTITLLLQKQTCRFPLPQNSHGPMRLFLFYNGAVPSRGGRYHPVGAPWSRNKSQKQRRSHFFGPAYAASAQHDTQGPCRISSMMRTYFCERVGADCRQRTCA